MLQYVEAYEGEEKCILQVRPGITDYSSIEFICLDEIVGDKEPDEMYEKLVLKRKNQLRIQYVQTVSIWTDITILFKTMGAVGHKAYMFIIKRK